MSATTYVKTDCDSCSGHIEYPVELAGQSIECPHCQHLTALPALPVPPPSASKKCDSATPKQIAFLTYVGVRGADQMTKQQASDAIDKLSVFSGDLDERERIEERRSKWITDRFILHSDLYAFEFRRFLHEELPELLHAFVRRQIVGSSERLPKAKIRGIVQTLTTEDGAWWQNPKREIIFFERLRQTYPGCCDGHAPDKTAARPPCQQRSPAPSRPPQLWKWLPH